MHCTPSKKKINKKIGKRGFGARRSELIRFQKSNLCEIKLMVFQFFFKSSIVTEFHLSNLDAIY
jgi:hypothetical protein